MPSLVFTRHADVSAVLADPQFAPPAPPPAGPPGTVAWLRATVARFSAGADHLRRRALVERELAGLDVPALRQASRERARARPEVSATDLARRIPVGVLAAALGPPGKQVVGKEVVGKEVLEEEVLEAVAAVAPAYHGGAGVGADAAVARLVAALGPGDVEALAARIGLLVQAYDATAGLIGNALGAARRAPRATVARWPVGALLAETLRYDPPVRVTRRVCCRAARVGTVEVGAGATVLLDLAAANRDPEVFEKPEVFDPMRADLRHLTFGGPPRLCPGRDHALAIAAGVVEGVLAG
jgi:cytochrome P450